MYGLPGQPAEEGRHLGCVRPQSGPGAGFRRVRVTGTACRGRPPSWLRACSVWAWCWFQACTGYRDSLPRKAAILAACVLSLGLVLVSGVYGLPGQPAEEGRHLGCVRAQSGPGAGFRRVRVTGTACRGRPPSWLRACSVWAWCWFQACTGYRDSLPRKAAILAACVLSLGLVLVSGVYGLPGQPAEEGRHLGCVRAQSGPGAAAALLETSVGRQAAQDEMSAGPC